MDTRKGKFEWSESILDEYGIDFRKLPQIIKLTDQVGTLSESAAKNLGLKSGIPLISGGGDLVSTAIGAGAIKNDQFALCLGTAAWIATHTEKRKIDLKHYIGPICSYKNKYLCISKQETGSVCLDWVKNHLFKEKNTQLNKENKNIYKFLDSLIGKSPPGANGIIFTPWMFGERSPVNNPNIRAGFHNLSLNHNRADFLRAVYEGVGYNLLWSLKELENLAGTTDSIRITGGGAKSDVWCQILANILNKSIMQLANPELGGVRGAAIIGLVGLDIFSNFSDIVNLIKFKKKYQPQPAHHKVYSKQFQAFLSFYEKNEDIFDFLNS
jgi:xylulokinase